MSMSAERIFDRIFRASRFDVEVQLVDAERTLCQFDSGAVALSGASQLLGIRVTNGRSSGFAISSDIGDWKPTLDRATKIMKASEPLEIEPSLSRPSKYPKVPAETKLWKFGDGRVIKLFEDMCDVELPIVSASLEKVNVEQSFANSAGASSSHRESSISGSIEVNRNSISAFDSHTDTKPFDFSRVSRSAVDLCMKSQKPVDIGTKRMSVLLDYFALESLLEKVFIPSFLASSVQRNRSVLAGRIGERVFSEKLTIDDVGTRYLNASPSDEEGTPSQRTGIVRNGELVGFLYDRYSARKDGVESTGNCASLASRPSIAPSNFVIKPGNGELPSKYLYVHSVSGAHTSNPVTGDFSVNVSNSFLVDADRKPVKHAMLSGNIFDLFRNVESVGRKPRQEGVIRSPPIIFSGVQVIG